jgi:hypothetical protein
LWAKWIENRSCAAGSGKNWATLRSKAKVR